MPGRFAMGDKVSCVRDGNAMGNKTSGTIVAVEKGVRNAGRGNWHGDLSVTFYCILDSLTCNLLQPDSLWRYSVRYDADGREETKVPAARIYRGAAAAKEGAAAARAGPTL